MKSTLRAIMIKHFYMIVTKYILVGIKIKTKILDYRVKIGTEIHSIASTCRNITGNNNENSVKTPWHIPNSMVRRWNNDA